MCIKNYNEWWCAGAPVKRQNVQTRFFKNLAMSCLQRMYVFIFYFIFTEVKLIYSVVLISAVQWSQLYTSTLFFIMVYYKDIEYSSPCPTVGPCCLSILCIIVSICQPQAPNPFLSPLPATSLFSMSVSLFLFWDRVLGDDF